MNFILIFPGNIIELFIMHYYWFSMLERRFEVRKTELLFWSVLLLNTVRCWLMFDMVSLKAIITTIVSLALMHLLFKDKWYKKVIVYTIYVACVVIAEFLAIVLAKYVYGYDMINLTEVSLPCFLWQGTVYILIIILNLIAVILIKKKHLDIESMITRYLFLYIAVQCLMIFVFTMLLYEYKVTSATLIVVVLGIMILSIGIGVIIYNAVRSAALKSAEAEFIKKESRLVEQHFAEVRAQYMEYKKLRHDFKNHLMVLKGIRDEKKLKEYTGAFEKQFIYFDDITFCDNPTIDSLLAIKRQEARKKGINIVYRICGFDGIGIADFDLCTVIANLLDNAIEAAEQTEERLVEMQINIVSERLVISLQNSALPPENGIESSKKNRELHGYGIKSIKTAISKYDGEYSFKYDNSRFVSVVNMKLK